MAPRVGAVRRCTQDEGGCSVHRSAGAGPCRQALCFSPSMSPEVPSTRPLSGDSLWSALVPLLPFMATVFAGFFAMGMALPVLPRHVHDTLGQGTVIVGVVMGSQYLSAVFGRMFAGGTV